MAIDNHGFTPDKNIYNLTSILSRLDALEQAGRALDFNKVYPVGSIYITTDNRNPTSYFTGTVWERYGQGKVIVGVNESDTDFNSAGKTGGSKTRRHGLSGSTDGTALEINQMPGHYHNLGKHSHAFQYTGSKGSSDHNIYTDLGVDPRGDYIVNTWIPKHETGSGALEDGTLQRVRVQNKAGNRLSVGDPEGETYTNVTGGNPNDPPNYRANAHTHTLKAASVEINTVQPYIACYIWRRKS